MKYRVIFLDSNVYTLTYADDSNLISIVTALVALKSKQIIYINLIGDEDE